eukprot:5635578-Lingulodinium_polyedra.AAC.1
MSVITADIVVVSPLVRRTHASHHAHAVQVVSPLVPCVCQGGSTANSCHVVVEAVTPPKQG